jgi:hypothetical protein
MMSTMKNETLVRWRRRAIEAKALANRLQTSFAKRSMMRVAATYKQLARRAAKRVQATIFSPGSRRRQGDLFSRANLPVPSREFTRPWQTPPQRRAWAIVPLSEQTRERLEAAQRATDERIRIMTGIKCIWPRQREEWLRQLPGRAAEIGTEARGVCDRGNTTVGAVDKRVPTSAPEGATKR